jgi:hypothetical protein
LLGAHLASEHQVDHQIQRVVQTRDPAADGPLVAAAVTNSTASSGAGSRGDHVGAIAGECDHHFGQQRAIHPWVWSRSMMSSRQI